MALPILNPLTPIVANQRHQAFLDARVGAQTFPNPLESTSQADAYLHESPLDHPSDDILDVLSVSEWTLTMGCVYGDFSRSYTIDVGAGQTAHHTLGILVDDSGDTTGGPVLQGTAWATHEELLENYPHGPIITAAWEERYEEGVDQFFELDWQLRGPYLVPLAQDVEGTITTGWTLVFGVFLEVHEYGLGGRVDGVTEIATSQQVVVDGQTYGAAPEYLDGDPGAGEGFTIELTSKASYSS